MSRYKPAGKLLGKSAIITGGDSGIGRAVAIAFAMEGADVAIVYAHNDDDAQDTAKMVGPQGRCCLPVKADVSKKAECARAIAETVAAFGKLSILVNNAAHQAKPAERFEDLTEEELRTTFDTNILGYFFMAQCALPHMSAGDSIVNTSSTTSIMGHPGMVDYPSTKAAINVFTRSLGLNLAPCGIRVNAVLPGPTWTPIIPASGGGPEMISNFASQSANQRPAQPEEMAPAYVYFASDDSTYTNATLMEISGGYISVG